MLVHSVPYVPPYYVSRRLGGGGADPRPRSPEAISQVGFYLHESVYGEITDGKFHFQYKKAATGQEEDTTRRRGKYTTCRKQEAGGLDTMCSPLKPALTGIPAATV